MSVQIRNHKVIMASHSINLEGSFDQLVLGEITPEQLQLFTAAQTMIESQFNINGKEDSDFHELFKN